jgi:prepilin-type N-terminal cleavage/methylation domain-containing protein
MKRSTRAFTLIEIMLVTLIVAILTGLAAFVIGRIKQRAALSLIQNNLRQYYQAKEFFYTESGSGQATSITALMRTGYLTKSAGMRMMNINGDSLEGRAGWHYYPVAVPNAPVFAYRGRVNSRGEPEGEAIYYPGKNDTIPVMAPPDATTGPSAGPDGTPAGGTPTQTTTAPTSAGGGATPNSNPPTNPNPDQAKPVTNPPQPQQHHGPGNSDFGHSHGKNKGNN